MIRLKICGMRTADEIAMSVSVGADALGFIFVPGPRQLTLDQAAALAQLVPPHMKRVGVFADSPRELVQTALERCGLHILQFAGSESPESCGSFDVPTILTVRDHAPPADVVQRARAIAIVADARKNGVFGGTGIRVRPEVAARIRDGAATRFLLAGGLTPDNVADAIDQLRPDGVDVRSGVERDGYKDPHLVAAFARAVKRSFARIDPRFANAPERQS